MTNLPHNLTISAGIPLYKGDSVSEVKTRLRLIADEITAHAQRDYGSLIRDSQSVDSQSVRHFVSELDKQTITFASQMGTTIGVSDDEMTGVSNTYSGNTYTFKPSYLNESFEAGSDIYTLQSEYDSDNDAYHEPDCSSFVKVPDAPGAGEPAVADTRVSAFRPYFTSAEVASGGARPVTRSIVFSNEPSQLKGVEEKGDLGDEDLGTLKIYSKKHKIVVESALTRAIDIRIVNPAGIAISTFTLEAGETVETRIVNAGVYIVQSADNRYIKKLVVK